jgi:DNA-binding response OmpR family regulator
MLGKLNNRRVRAKKERLDETMASRSRVLIVEDDPLVSEVVADALCGAYETSQAETSAAALECLRAGGIDVMLLDCTLPGGLDPHLVPMADNSGIPVILMSGHPDMMERVSGMKRLCIQKPFSLAALLATIESVVPSERLSQAAH